MIRLFVIRLLMVQEKEINMNQKNSDDSLITIRNTFKIKEVEQLINKCSYTPYYDTPAADDLIQFAAYTHNNKLIGFISCVVPEFLYNDDSNMEKAAKTAEIEITAMVDPAFRKQEVFTTLFSELKLYIASCCDHINMPLPRIKYIAANKKYQDAHINSPLLKYSHSEYLMTLMPSDFSLNFPSDFNGCINNCANKHINNDNISNINSAINNDNISNINSDIILCTDNQGDLKRVSINKNILNKKYIVDKDDEEYKLINTFNNTVITSIAYSIYDNSICIHDVITKPYYRRTGCARYLLSVMISELCPHDRDDVTNSFVLHVSGRNTAAVNLYTSMGFRISDEIKYYGLS